MEWAKRNPEKVAKSLAKWRANNPGVEAEKMRKLRESEEFKEKERVYYREYYNLNQEKLILKTREWKNANPEKVAIKRKGWWDKNPGARNCSRMKRHAAKLQSIPMWADQDSIKKFYIEARQKSLDTGKVWHVDHIYPLQSDVVCGLHVETNLQVIPASANRAKSNKLIAESYSPT